MCGITGSEFRSSPSSGQLSPSKTRLCACVRAVQSGDLLKNAIYTCINKNTDRLKSIANKCQAPDAWEAELLRSNLRNAQTESSTLRRSKSSAGALAIALLSPSLTCQHCTTLSPYASCLNLGQESSFQSRLLLVRGLISLLRLCPVPEMGIPGSWHARIEEILPWIVL